MTRKTYVYGVLFFLLFSIYILLVADINVGAVVVGGNSSRTILLNNNKTVVFTARIIRYSTGINGFDIMVNTTLCSDNNITIMYTPPLFDLVITVANGSKIMEYSWSQNKVFIQVILIKKLGCTSETLEVKGKGKIISVKAKARFFYDDKKYIIEIPLSITEGNAYTKPVHIAIMYSNAMSLLVILATLMFLAMFML